MSVLVTLCQVPQDSNLIAIRYLLTGKGNQAVQGCAYYNRSNRNFGRPKSCTLQHPFPHHSLKILKIPQIVSNAVKYEWKFGSRSFTCIVKGVFFCFFKWRQDCLKIHPHHVIYSSAFSMLFYRWLIMAVIITPARKKKKKGTMWEAEALDWNLMCSPPRYETINLQRLRSGDKNFILNINCSLRQRVMIDKCIFKLLYTRWILI